MSKHIHADLMLQYAQDAMTTDKPWELWEFKNSASCIWSSLAEHPSWYENLDYRRKPRTININGFDVPEPVREPLEIDEVYYTFNLSTSNIAGDTVWDGRSFDLLNLKRGLIHLTKEAAELHAKALLSFTEVQP